MKKFAVISDIHGNYKALEAFLEFCEKHPVDGVICLGDYVTDSPYPERTMALLYRMREQYPCYMVRGNRENYLLDNLREDKGWKPSSGSGSLYYTSKHLTKADMEFLGNLPEEMRIVPEEGVPLYICHGVPGACRGNVELEEGLREAALERIGEKFLLGGHSHHQEIFKRKGKTYLNPGSLGLAIDGVGRRAQFAVMTFSDITVDISLHAISYDVEGFLEDFAESGLENCGLVLTRSVKKTLVTGINYFYQTVVEVEKEAAQLPRPVSEEVWNKVAERLGL